MVGESAPLATDFKISFNRYTTRGNRRYGNPGKEGKRGGGETNNTRTGALVKLPAPASKLGRCTGKSTADWEDLFAVDQPRLHSSFLLVYILLILPPPPPALLSLLSPSAPRSFSSMQNWGRVDRRPRMEAGCGDRGSTISSFYWIPGWLAPGYLETRPRKERFRVTTPAPPPRAPIRLYCRGFPRKLAVYFALPRIHDTMIAPPISVIGPKFFPLGGGRPWRRSEGYLFPPFSNLESFFFFFFFNKYNLFTAEICIIKIVL